jgi:hypothetical protein
LPVTCTTCGPHSAEARVVRDYLEKRREPAALTGNPFGKPVAVTGPPGTELPGRRT